MIKQAFVNLFNVLSSGGLVMIPLILCSIVSLAVIIERFYNLRFSKVINLDLVDMVTSLIETGEIQKATQLCHRNVTPIAI